MLYHPDLREVEQKNLQFKAEIQDSLKGVDFDYFFTGKREGTGGAIELHITSIVTDWETNTYTRQSIYRGNKGKWRECGKTYHLPSKRPKCGRRNHQGDDKIF